MGAQLKNYQKPHAERDTPCICTSDRESSKEAVKDYIRRKIDASDKSQVQIATDAGFPKPNVLSMIKNGQTAVPLSRIPALARAIDVEPKTLLTKCLLEYKPGLFEVLCEVYDIAYDPAEVQQKYA
jgi:hypothetical protein